MKDSLFRRILSGFLAVLMVLSNMPVMALAAEDGGLCPHHETHEGCSFTEAIPGSECTHVCDENCQTLLESCVHTHDGCGYVPAVEGTPCDHVCGDCGYVPEVPGTPCDHTHGDCGYAEGEEGTPCDHVCGDCGYAEAVEEIPCDHVCGEECAEGCVHTCGDGTCAYSEAIPGSDCGHVCGDGSCGYSEGTPGSDCGHVCGDGTCAYSEGSAEIPCAHSCADGTCAYSQGSEEVPCGHECSEASGCVTPAPDCRHVHDDSCGYAEAVKAKPCDYVCKVCQIQSMIDALPTEVSEENRQDVENALAAIDAFAASLTQEELDQVDYTLYEAAEAALDQESLSAEGVDAVRELVAALPTVTQLHAMNQAGLDHAYEQTQTAYEAYLELTAEQQAQLTEELAVLEALLDEFAQLKELDYQVDKAYGPNSQIGSAETAEALWPYAGYRFYLKQTVDGTTYVNSTRKDTAVEGQYWLDSVTGSSTTNYIYLEPDMNNPGCYYAYTKLGSTYLYLKTGGYGDYVAVDTTQYNYVWKVETVNGVNTLVRHADWGDYYATYNNGYWYLEEAPSAYAKVTLSTTHSSHSYTAVETAGTCTSEGYTTYTCNTCGLRYWADFTGDSGHAYQNATYVWAEDKSSADVTLTCASCGETKTQTVASEKELITPPTCTEPGEYRYCVTVEYGDGSSATRYDYGPAEPTGHETASDGACVNCDFIGGTFGEGLSWEYSNATGIVTVSGTGAIPDYNNPGTSETGLSPWHYQTVRGVVIDEGITAIGAFAFAAEPVASLELPGTLTSVGRYAFSDCTALTDVHYNGTRLQWAAVSLKDGNEPLTGAAFHYLDVCGDNHSFENGSCTGCGAVAVVITVQPESVIAKENAIVSIRVTAQGDGLSYAWYQKNAGQTEYDQVTALTAAVYTTTMTAALDGSSIYCVVTDEYGNTATTEVITATLDPTVGGSCGENVTWSLNKKTGVLTVSGEGPMADYTGNTNMPWYSYLSSVKEVVVEEGVTSVGARTFRNFTAITSVTLADSVTSIGAGAFYNCRGLTEFTVPEGVSAIQSGTFCGCENITRMMLPQGVIRIYNDAFTYCYGLKEIVLPNSLDTVDSTAFDPCGLTDVYFVGPQSLWESVSIGSYNESLTNANIHYNVTGPCYGLHTAEVLPGVTGTCQTPGLTEGSKCSVCGETLVEQVEYLGDHTLENGICTACKVYGTCGENLTWTFADGTLTVSGSGAMEDYTDTVAAPWNALKGSITKVVIESGVTKIGHYAFYGCTKLAEVEIADTVTDLGMATFRNCTALTAVTVPNGVTALNSSLFHGCTKLADVTLPESLTAIYGYAFQDCAGLTSIDLPQAVTAIGSGAFQGCTSLTYLEIPSGVTAISYYMLGDCSALTGVSVPAGVTSIGQGAFSGCSSLEEIGIPAGVWTIGSSAFNGCSSLKAVTIPEEVTVLEDSVFFECSDLNSVTISGEITTVGNHAFGFCSALTEISLPDTVTSIGDGAFIHCTNLKSVSMPQTVLSIGEQAFRGCSSLTEITVPEGITVLNNYVLAECTALKSCVLPESLATIGEGALSGCSSLTEIRIPDAVTSIGKQAFASCRALVRAELPQGLTAIAERAFQWCSELVYITVPDSVTSIGERAFDECSALTAMTLPAGLTNLGAYALAECTSLKTVNIPENLTVLPSGVFFNSGLESIAIPNGVTAIEERALSCCDDLTEIILPESVKTLGAKAFSLSYNLKNITFTGDAPAIGSDAFKDVTATAYYLTSANGWTADVLQNYGGNITWVGSANQGYAGENVRWVYEEDTKNLLIYGSGPMYDFGQYSHERLVPWAAFSSEIETVVIKSGVTYVGDYTFRDCAAMYEITLPEGITAIGDYALQNCAELMELKLPASLREIGEYAFDGCSLILELVIPAGITAIPKNMASNCTRLETVTIPDSVTSIGSWAFGYDTSLIGVTLPAGLTVLENHAFYHCERITEIEIPGGVETVGDSAFSGCEALTEVKLNSGIKVISDHAFAYNDKLASVNLPEGITTIGEYAFGSASLKEITLPSTLTSLGARAFIYTDIQQIVIPEGIRRIYAETFRGCGSLRSVTIPASVRYIDENAFQMSYHSGCTITFLGSAPSFVYNCFSGAKLVCYYPYGDSTWTTAKLQSYEGTSVTWCPYGVVGESVSWKLDETGTLTLSGSGSIPDYELSAPWAAYSDRIYRIVVEDGVTGIGSNAFTGCTGVKVVEFMGSAPAIAENAFTGITAHALHYVNDASWSSAAGKSYGGQLTWLDESSVIASGTNNSVLKWTLNAEGTLYIYGQGEMNGYGTTPAWLSYQTQIRKVIIAEGVTHIGYYAFSGCTNLETVVIPSTVISFNQFSFNNCASLREITIPDGVESIPGQAFGGCASLTEVTIPASVTSLNSFAFSGCTGLQKIVFEGSAPTLPEYQYNTIFSGVTYPAIVYYPAGDSTWTEDVFNKLGPKLIWIAQGETENHFQWYVDNYGTLQIIGEGAMPDYTGNAPWAGYASVIRRVKFDALITYIGSNALAGCPNVQLMTFGNPAPAFSDTAFAGVTAYACYTGSDRSWSDDKLQNYGGQITWQNVANVSTEALCGEKLTFTLDEYGTMFIFGTGEMDEDSTYWKLSSFPVKKVIITEGATNIAESAFSGCNELAEIVLPETLTSIGWYAFQGSNLTQVTVPEKVTSIGWYAFSGCNGLTSVKLPEGLTELGQYAFMGCTALTSVNIPASLTTLSGMVFSNTGLTEFTVPGTVTEVKNAVISDCKNLTSVTFEEGVTTVGSYMFKNCPALETVVFPASVTEIGSDLFEDTHGNISVWFHGAMPAISDGAFTGLRGMVYYPSGAEGWENRPDYAGVTWQPYCSGQHREEVLPAVEPTCTQDGLTEGRKCSVCGMVTQKQEVVPAAHKYTDGFCEFCGLMNGDLGEGLTATFDAETNTLRITGSGAMKNFADSGEAPWSALRDRIEKVAVEQGVTTIGDYAFIRCDSLSQVLLPEGITGLGTCAFESCEAMEAIELPDSLQSIGWCAFLECKKLAQITLPDAVEIIGESAFSGCIQLTEINIPAGVKTIRNKAFGDTLRLKTVRFLGDAPAMEEYAFYNVTANVSYPADNTTWTEETRKDYGGHLTWLPSTCTEGHTEAPLVGYEATCTEDGLTEGVYCSACGTVLVEQTVIPAGHNVENGICTGCQVYGTCGENLTWTFADGVLTITGTGDITDMEIDSTGRWYVLREQVTEVVIPEGVTAIGAEAFNGFTGLTTVTVPATVTTLGNGAFLGCSALVRVELPEGLTSIGTFAFSGCENLVYITVPSTLTSLGKCAFTGCSSLTSMEIPEGITKISEGLFHGCIALRSVVIANSITDIEDSAFMGCSCLSEVTLPSGISTIGDSAFRGCVSLTSMTIPETVTLVKSAALAECTGLKYITFAGDAPVMTYEAFVDVTATGYYLTSATGWDNFLKQYHGGITWVGTDNQGYAGPNVRWVYEADTRTLMIYGSGPMYDFSSLSSGHSVPWENLLPEIEYAVIKSGVTTVGDMAFYQCSNLYEVTLPDGITKIGEIAFQGCPELMEVVLPDTVQYIGEGAFYGCSTLLYLDIPEGVTEIPEYMCYGCTRMERLTIPDTVTVIKYNAFDGCSSLAELKLPAGLTEIGTWAFNGCNRFKEVNIPGGVTVIPEGAFANCGALEKVTLNSVVTDIGNSAFSGSYSLTQMNFPEGLKTIGEYAFTSTGIKKLHLPNTVTTVKPRAFENSQVEEVVLSSGMRRIPEGAFMYCYSLRSVVIPESVKLIDAYAFMNDYDCEITFLGSAPTSIMYNSFSDADLVCYYPYGDSSWTDAKLQSYEGSHVVWCPYGTAVENVSWKLDEKGVLVLTGPGGIADFEVSAPWAAFADRIGRIVIGEGIRVIGANAFTGCTNALVVEFLGSAPAIADNAFTGVTASVLLHSEDEGWTSVSGKDYGGKLAWQDISKRVLSGSDGYGNVYWTLDSNGCLVIYGIGSMAALNTGIWRDDPEIRDSIREVIILEGITDVAEHAFQYLYELESVTLPDSLTKIDGFAFYCCHSLKDVRLPGNLETLNSYAFYECKSLDSITIPASVTMLGSCVFQYCSNLKEIVFEGSATENFYTTSIFDLTGTAYYPGNDPSWTEELRSSLNSWILWIPYNTAGETVRWNYDSATGELNIFGTGVLDSDIAAAWSTVASGVRSICIGGDITAITDDALSGFTGLRHVIFEGGAPLIGESAFSGIDATVFYPDRDQSWQNVTGNFGGKLKWLSFNGRFRSGTCGDALRWILDKDGQLYIYGTGEMQTYDYYDPHRAPWYPNREQIRKVTILEGVTTVGNYAFDEVRMTSVKMPEGLTKIGLSAFEDCTQLTAVEIPATVTEVSTQAFYNCSSMETLILHEGLEIIRWNAFSGCDKLKEVTIPASVVNLGLFAFAGDVSLKEITFLGDAPERDNPDWTDNHTVFGSVTAKAYYPANNATWTRDAMLGFGGELTWICLSCKDGHTEQILPALEPTCKDYGMTEGRKCSACSLVLVEQTKLPMLEHSFTDGVCGGCGAQAVRILEQPKNAAAGVDQIVTLSMIAEGEGLSYNWYICNYGELEFYVDCTDNVYQVSVNEFTDGRQIYCVITDTYGNTVTTDTVTVRLVYPPLITEQPESVGAKPGENAIVSFEAQGEDLTYEWYVYDPNTGEYRIDDSFHGSSYTYRMRLDSPAWFDVYCVVTDPYGQKAQTNTAGIMQLLTPLTILEHPESVYAEAGKEVTVRILAEGEALTYRWYYSDPNTGEFYLAPEFTGNAYTVTMSDSIHGSEVYCVVTDGCGQTVESNRAVLNRIYNSVSILSQPKSVSVPMGEEASVQVIADGDEITYAWYCKLPGSDEFVLDMYSTDNGFARNMSEEYDGCQVYCVITDRFGCFRTTDTATLSMTRATELKIVRQPVPAAVFNGQIASVDFEVQGDGLTYQWYFKNPGSSKFTLTTSYQSNVYSVTMNESRSGRQVYCMVTDKYGNTAATNTVTLSMLSNIQSGQCGDAYGYVTWTLDVTTGVLTIADTGRGNEYMGYWEPIDIGTSPWYRFREYIRTAEITGKIRNIGAGAFYDCYNLTKVTMTDTVESIDQRAFSGCSSLTELTLSPAVKHVSAWVFENCTALEKVTFLGSAPSFSPISFEGAAFHATYIDDGSWNGRLQNYGGQVTWSPVPQVRILTQPVSVSVPKGQIATVTVEAAGDGLTYAWYFKNPGATKFSLTTSYKSNTYSATMDAARNGRQVYCVITDAYGNTAKTDTVTLSMAKTPMAILRQPAPAEAAKGKVAKVTLEAQGDDLTYQWYYKNPGASKFSLTTSFKSNSYSVTMDAARNGRQVYCVITDGYGDSVTTDTVALTMTGAVKITAQPESVEVSNGQVAKITLEAQGDGLTYKWYIKNPGASKFNLTTSYTSNFYSATMNASRNGRQVYCVITDSYGNTVTSNVATMSMTPTPLAITKQPVSVEVAKGKVAAVQVEAQGDNLTYQWYYKNPGVSKFSLTTSFTSNSYSITMDAARNGRQVYCIITDGYGKSVTTDTVTLSMNTSVPVITRQPVSVEVASGKIAEVSLEATGDGLTYAWYFKNPGASKFSLTTSYKSNSYSVTMNASRSGRQVYCVITDANGNSVTTNTVTLTMSTNGPVITAQPKSVEVASGKVAQVTVEATGDGLTYAWYFKNPGASKFSLTTSYKSNTYSVNMNADRNGRQVYCVITDAYGNSVTTNTATLTMSTNGPVITVQPKSVAVASGKVATVTLEATGEGLTYAWYFKNPGASKFSLTTSYKSNTYSVNMNADRNGRQVYCVITDANGNSVTTDTVTLSMEGALRITAQPKSVAVASGKVATVTVAAAGEGLSYQWYFKNPGATKFSLTNSYKSNVYSVTMNASRSGRQVYCVVTDKHGNTVKTNAVTLKMK